MKKIYRADDGTEFEIESDCIAYEGDSKPLMWDSYKRRIDEVMFARYIYLCDKSAVKNFHRLQCAQGALAPLDRKSPGFFCWNEEYNVYQWIDTAKLKHVLEFMHKVCPEEFKEENS